MTGLALRVIDELEVGAQAAKVWAWTDHYCPPPHYARIRREQAERASRAAETPRSQPASIGGPGEQLELFRVGS